MIIAKRIVFPVPAQLGLFLVCLGALLSPLMPTIAQSQPTPKPTTPEKRRPPATNGRSAGSRGCAFETASAPSPTFRLLVPPSGPPNLIAKQPTFGWTVGHRIPVAVIFRLYAVADHQSLPQILVEERLDDIPADAKRLSYTVQEPLVQGTYLWQVELVCDRDRPSGNIALQSQFHKLETPLQLQTVLAASPTTTIIQELQVAGYWYDLYSTTLRSSETAALGNGFAYGIKPILLSTDHPEQ